MRAIRLFLLGLLLATGLAAPAQAPPPGTSEQALKEAYVPDDGKPTQGRTEAPPSGWRALGSMFLVLGLAGGGLYAFRKWGAKRLPGSGGSRLAVEETLALGDRRFVSILRADDEKFLVSLGPQGVSLIARLDSVEAPAPTDFSEALARETEISTPMPVRDVEALMRGER
ncbi:MAG TPA: flagellar biosynthetic protein FliO [Holophaga sp.]|nr:flagellar biosynthetic protein FliO [Holophaga sp.]